MLVRGEAVCHLCGRHEGYNEDLICFIGLEGTLCDTWQDLEERDHVVAWRKSAKPFLEQLGRFGRVVLYTPLSFEQETKCIIADSAILNI